MNELELEQHWIKSGERGSSYLGNRLRKLFYRDGKEVAPWGNDPHTPNPSALCSLGFLSLNKIKNILEIGCGYGRDAIFFAIKGIKVTAVNYSTEAIAFAKFLAKLNKVKVNFLELDYLNEFSLEDNFDAIVAIKFLHQIRRNRAHYFLKTINNNLNLNGIFILTTFAAEYDHNFERGNKIEVDVWEVREYRPIVFWRIEKLIELIKDNGFEIINYFLLEYLEKNHPEEGEERGGSHTHGLWFIVGKKINES